MSLRPEPIGPVPEETARVARARNVQNRDPLSVRALSARTLLP